MGLSVSRDVCKCTDLTAGIRVDFEAKEAAEDHPEGWFGASREPSTSYDGGHTDLPAKARYFLTQSTAISRKMFAPEVQGAFRGVLLSVLGKRRTVEFDRPWTLAD